MKEEKALEEEYRRVGGRTRTMEVRRTAGWRKIRHWKKR
jgi:hypothetical protein